VENREKKPKEEVEVKWGRILNKSVFLTLLDLEVKRARRYQNFLSVLILRLNALSKEHSGDLQTCYQMVANLLTEETRESDIIGHLSKDRVGVLLPYADVSAGSEAKSRFEDSLKYCDFKSKGCEVRIDQVSFPTHGTNTESLVKKVLEREPLRINETEERVQR
jgi:GGDEF domain-containing protein